MLYYSFQFGPVSLCIAESEVPSDKLKVLSLYALSRYRGRLQFTFLSRDLLQDCTFRKAFKNTCKDDENRSDTEPGRVQTETGGGVRHVMVSSCALPGGD